MTTLRFASACVHSSLYSCACRLHRQLRKGGRSSEQSSARATSSTRAPFRRLCSSTASERWFESGRFNGIDYYDNGQHDGRRGRALGAERAGVGGAGGVDAAFFASFACGGGALGGGALRA